MGLRIDDIAILSEELRRVMAAGLPLESSLARMAAGRGKRLQRFLKVLGERLERGEDLSAIVASQQGSIPRMAAAALGAGLQSGRPGLALELMGEYARDVRQLRAEVSQAAAYPLIVAATASLLLLTVIQGFFSRYYDITVVQGMASISPTLTWLLEQNASHPAWVVLPGLSILLVLAVWHLSGRASAMAFRGPEKLLFLLPGIRMQVQYLQSYTLSRMLALLTSHQIPFPVSLRLAGAASGSASLERACWRMAEEATAGTAASGSDTVTALPPLLACCLRQTDRNERVLRERLQSTASYYRQQFEHGQILLQFLLPTVLFLTFTAGSVLTVALAVFWPVVELYNGLS
jgi:general secretion pathway protein F